MNLKGIVDRKLVLLVATPLLRRVGTVVATWLIATGAPSDTVEALGLWAGAGIGILVDLGLAYLHKRKVANDTRLAILEWGELNNMEGR